MALIVGYFWLVPFLGSIFCCFYLLKNALPELVKGEKNLIIAFSIAFVVYIIFKQSFVRADGHTKHFYSMLLPLTSLLYYFINTTRLAKAYKLVIIPLFMFSVLGYGKSFIARQFDSLIHGQEENIRVTSHNLSAKELCALPEKVLAIIGDSTTDVFGNSVSYIYFNGLKYKPRPVFQSYVAYNEKLMELNYKSWMDQNGPEYLLFHFGSIDDRHPFWDEPLLYDAVFTNYELIDTIRTRAEKLILFQKVKKEVTVTENILKDTMIRWGDEIAIPDTAGYTYAKIWFDYSYVNKALRLLLQPILPEIILTYEDTAESKHRMIKTIFPSGLPIENKILTFQHAEMFFKHQDEGNIKTETMTLKGSTFWFKPTVRVQFVSKDWIEG